MADEERYGVLINAFRPRRGYHFPSRVEYGISRSFQRAWVDSYNWLSCSPSLDGGFCVPSVLFSLWDQSRGS